MSVDLVEFPPCAELRGVVARATDFRESGPPTRRVERPLVGAVLIVSLGPDLLVDDRPTGSFACGVWERPTRTGHDGEQAGYQLTLGPEAGRALFGMPLAELADELVDLDAVLGAGDARELQERVAAAPDAAARHAAAQDVLARRMQAAPPAALPPAVAYALWRLRATHGAVRIEALAAELGCSRRYLAAQVRAEIGVGPKVLARMLRIDHAVERVQAGEPLAEVAYAAGFADQPHFNREFLALVGCAPTAFPFLQDVAVAA